MRSFGSEARRPDLQLARPGHPTMRIATAFPYPTGERLTKTYDRLSKLTGPEQRLIVIPREHPPNAKIDELVDQSADIPVIHLDELADWLEASLEEIKEKEHEEDDGG